MRKWLNKRDQTFGELSTSRKTKFTGVSKYNSLQNPKYQKLRTYPGLDAVNKNIGNSLTFPSSSVF